MIEIVYKENKEQANGNEGYFHLPKNIRQVGDTNGRERIYLEDYVGTFLKKYFSAPEGRAAMLFGEFKWADGISYFFIRSAAAIHTMEPAPDHLVFDDAVWTEVHDVMEKYFKNQQILGWALSLPGYGEDLNEQIIRAHLNHFGGNDKTLFRVNGQEKEETFYTYEGGTLRSTGGFYIYYEKNPEMQNYMINTRKENGVTPSEVVEDRAAKDFRSAVREKMECKEQHQSSKFAYITSALLVLIVLVIGITTVNNFDKMKLVQTSLENLSKSMENGQTEEDTKTTTAAEAKEGAKEVSGTVKKSEEAKVSREEESQLTDKDYYVVQKGETLAGVSKKLYGDTSHVKAICKMNGLSDGNLIYIGQKLLLP